MAADPAQLHRRARDGDRDAFAALAAPARPRLQRYLTAMTGCPHTADDLVQESLQTAIERLEQLREPHRFEPWLLSIACNKARSSLRRDVQRAHGGDGPAPDIAAQQHTALSSLVRREDAARLQLAIDRLPILLREAFVLFVVEGLHYADIAPLLGATEGTLQVRVHRAKALLRQQLGAVFDTWTSGR